MPTLGLDFGTSTTLVGQRDNYLIASVVPIGRGTRWMPTIAAVVDTGELVFGEEAEAEVETRCIRSIKTALGLGHELVTLPLPGPAPVTVEVDEVVSALLGEAARRAGLSSEAVRMACPAHWEGEARRRLVKLAAGAGIATSVDDLLDEPIAAGISWIMHSIEANGAPPSGRAVVFDPGGGTLDVAVLEVRSAQPLEVTVLSSLSVNEAGDTLDRSIAGELIADLQSSGELAGEPDPVLEHLIRAAARRLKEDVSSVERAERAVGGGYDLPPLVLDRRRLEAIFEQQLDHAMNLVDAALRAAELRRRDAPSPDKLRSTDIVPLRQGVTNVLLSGGLSRIPAVQHRLAETFPRATVEADAKLGNPEESVVTGLCFDDVVSDLNLHRPAFDFVVEYLDERTGEVLDQIVAYPAFSPLYTRAQVLRGETSLGYRTELPLPPRCARAVARLSCRSTDGEELELQINGVPAPAITLPLSHGGGAFKLYADGRVLLRGIGERVLRVERWPILRSSGGPRRLHMTTGIGWPDVDPSSESWRYK